MINHPNRRRKTVASVPAHNHEVEYPQFEEAVRETFGHRAQQQLFQTSASGLYELYIGNLPSDAQVHNCNACKRFIEKFGGLAVIDDLGQIDSAVWPLMTVVPPFYQKAAGVLFDAVNRAKITGPFYSRENVYGMPHTGVWTHLHAMPVNVYRDRAKEPHEKTASKLEDFKTVTRALAEFKPKMLDEAIRILEADALSRSDRFLAPAKWLRALHDRPKGKAGTNLLWKAIANAPEGFCHPRAGVLGPLLENIAAGKPFAEIQREFAAMLHPLRYQRPHAAPSAGNIAQAEKLVEKLGIARSLERRFARLDEVRKIWEPREIDKPQAGGVFGHLMSNADSIRSADLPTQTMTWAKFSASVMPNAEKMTLRAPDHGDYVALTSAVHMDAPPILQCDRDDARYPIGQYRYHGGSPRVYWGVGVGWVEVTAIVPSPTVDKEIFAILAGARDSLNNTSALFPETLKADLHAVRSTIEAHSNVTKLSGYEDANACGLPIVKAIVRVLSRGAWTTYHVDRWD